MNFQLALSRQLSDKSDMTRSNPLADRIEERLKDLGTNAFAAADSVKLERNFINDILNDKKKSVRADGLYKIATALKTTAEWLSGQPGAVKDTPYEPRRVSIDEEWREQKADYERVEVDDQAYSSAAPYRSKIIGGVPELDMQAGAGEGANGEVYVLPTLGGTVAGHRVLAEWKFSEQWLRAEVKASPSKTVVIPVVGDSMAPTYRTGDRLLVDTTQQEIVDGVVFVVRIDDGAPTVKRILEVYQSRPRMLTIVSDNPAIKDREVEASLVDVIGRVVGKVSVE